MQGGGGTREKVARLEKIISDQRALIAKYVNPNPAEVPQNFVPYKEVLTLYRHGLKVPEDVTLVWVDDNHGYIRQLSDAEELKRGGGSGVYYHISYWGAPEDYLWIETTPPALIREEMHKAYENGAQRVWILNVGDIKPGEIAMEFFLRLAWNVESWKEKAQPAFLRNWAERNFGKSHAPEIADILQEFYRLNFPAKPEHLHLVKFTKNYDEIDDRLRRFEKLVQRTDAAFEKLPADKRDAFYEMIAYPVRGSALANQMHLSDSAAEAEKAYEQIQTETKCYNEQIAGGKWRHMMSSNPRDRPALRKPVSMTNTNFLAGSNEDTLSATNSPTETEFISFEAEHPTRQHAGNGTAWKTISGLGRSGDSIALLPTMQSISSNAALDYDFTTKQSNALKVIVYCLPTQPIHSGIKARYSVAIDSAVLKTNDISAAEYSRQWSTNVLRAAAIETTDLISIPPGQHTLTVHPIDPGLVFDKVVIDFGGLKPTHLGPPETLANQ